MGGVFGFGIVMEQEAASAIDDRAVGSVKAGQAVVLHTAAVEIRLALGKPARPRQVNKKIAPREPPGKGAGWPTIRCVLSRAPQAVGETAGAGRAGRGSRRLRAVTTRCSQAKLQATSASMIQKQLSGWPVARSR